MTGGQEPLLLGLCPPCCVCRVGFESATCLSAALSVEVQVLKTCDVSLNARVDRQGRLAFRWVVRLAWPVEAFWCNGHTAGMPTVQ